jgi:hypothetical protein
LTDLNQFLKPQTYSLAEFKQEMQSKALINLYLSSLTDLAAKPPSIKDPYSYDPSEEEDNKRRKQSIMA